MEKITKDMPIGDVVAKHPETAEILMNKGMHCVGCHMAQMESIEAGCKGHGMDDKAIDEMMEEINEAINKEKKE